MIHEKIDGINFEKLMNGELAEDEFAPDISDTTTDANTQVNSSDDETASD